MAYTQLAFSAYLLIPLRYSLRSPSPRVLWDVSESILSLQINYQLRGGFSIFSFPAKHLPTNHLYRFHNSELWGHLIPHPPRCFGPPDGETHFLHYHWTDLCTQNYVPMSVHDLSCHPLLHWESFTLRSSSPLPQLPLPHSKHSSFTCCDC